MNIPLQLMETLILGAKGVTILSTLGKDIVLNTLKLSSKSVVSGLGYITSNDQPSFKQIQKRFRTMDLEFKIKIIGKLIEEQNSYDDLEDSVKDTIIGVNDVLNKIDKEIKTIITSMKNHQLKWFRGWRSFDCSCNIETIEEHKKLLDTRYEMLTTLLKIYQHNKKREKKMLVQTNTNPIMQDDFLY